MTSSDVTSTPVAMEEGGLTAEAIEKMTVVQLKTELRMRSISFNPKDKKADLQAKLIEAIQEANAENEVRQSDSLSLLQWVILYRVVDERIRKKRWMRVRVQRKSRENRTRKRPRRKNPSSE